MPDLQFSRVSEAWRDALDMFPTGHEVERVAVQAHCSDLRFHPRSAGAGSLRWPSSGMVRDGLGAHLTLVLMVRQVRASKPRRSTGRRVITEEEVSWPPRAIWPPGWPGRCSRPGPGRCGRALDASAFRLRIACVSPGLRC